MSNGQPPTGKKLFVQDRIGECYERFRKAVGTDCSSVEAYVKAKYTKNFERMLPDDGYTKIWRPHQKFLFDNSAVLGGYVRDIAEGKPITKEIVDEANKKIQKTACKPDEEVGDDATTQSRGREPDGEIGPEGGWCSDA